MTQPGETQHFTLSDHVRAIRHHTGRKFLDWAVVNDAPIAPDIARRYRAEGAMPVYASAEEVEQLGLRGVFGDIVEAHGKIRHDSQRLASLLLNHFVAQAHTPTNRRRRIAKRKQ
jgi:2-phospho-L-lactate transferase/gluconeogenesis factor (CofD/UPF0052 family)